MWGAPSQAIAVALTGILLGAWGFPKGDPTESPHAEAGTRVFPIAERWTDAEPLLPLAMAACRQGVDLRAGLEPSLRKMLGYEGDTALKRIVKEGDHGEQRWLLMAATHCIGKEVGSLAGITLLLTRAFEAAVDEPAWTAYYYKTSLSGELVATIYGIHGDGQPHFMNIGVNDDRVQEEWEAEKSYWLSKLP